MFFPFHFFISEHPVDPKKEDSYQESLSWCLSGLKFKNRAQWLFLKQGPLMQMELQGEACIKLPASRTELPVLCSCCLRQALQRNSCNCISTNRNEIIPVQPEPWSYIINVFTDQSGSILIKQNSVFWTNQIVRNPHLHESRPIMGQGQSRSRAEQSLALGPPHSHALS